MDSNIQFTKLIGIKNSKKKKSEKTFDFLKKKNRNSLYESNFLKVKSFYRYLSRSPNYEKFLILRFETRICIFRNFDSLKALDHKLRKITFSIKKSLLVEFSGGLKFRKYILLFLVDQKYLIVLNLNCFIGAFMKKSFLKSPCPNFVKWNLQIFFSLEILGILNFLSKTFNKKKKFNNFCSILTMKSSFLQFFTVIDITSKRILIEILFSQICKEKKNEEISYGLDGSLLIKKCFKKSIQKNSLFFFFELIFFFFFTTTIPRIEYSLIRLENFFFSIQINYQSIKIPFNCLSFRYCWFKRKQSCTGFNLWMKTPHENWGALEPEFKDLNKSIEKNIELYSNIIKTTSFVSLRTKKKKE